MKTAERGPPAAEQCGPEWSSEIGARLAAFVSFLFNLPDALDRGKILLAVHGKF
jgi:hypothetical protein